MHSSTKDLTGIHWQGKFEWWRQHSTLRIATIIMFVIGVSSTAYGQSPLELLLLETVNYDALPSPLTNFDRPLIAVRDDGLIRIAITDFQDGCCPLISPLKVATRGAMGDWTYMTITNYGDHPVAHFLSSGELGVLSNDYEDQFTIKFARVGDTSVQIEPVVRLGWLFLPNPRQCKISRA